MPWRKWMELKLTIAFTCLALRSGDRSKTSVSRRPSKWARRRKSSSRSILFAVLERTLSVSSEEQQNKIIIVFMNREYGYRDWI